MIRSRFRENLCELIRIVYESANGCSVCQTPALPPSMQKGLEHLILLLYGLEGSVNA